jgi:CBS domain-containing protein
MVPVKSFMVPREKFITVERDTDAQTAARIMRDRGIGSLFVTNGKEIVGILTDTEEGKTLLDANDLMAQSHLRHLGVTRDGKLVGMISVRDLVVFLTNLPRK